MTEQSGAAATVSRQIDLERARRDTPGCEDIVHLNNAGASPMPIPVVDAVIEHLRAEVRYGGYHAADAAHARLDRTYDAIATLIGCERDEVALAENATRAWDMAFYALRLQPGDRILTGRAEYAGNLIAMLQVCARTGATVEMVPDDECGQISVEALKSMLDERVRVIALTHVPTQGGLVNPAAAVGAIARQHGVTYVLDACQSVGQREIDVDTIGCDVLTATGRKFLRGPRGTGFLYVRRPLLAELEPPFLDLHAATLTSARAYTMRDDARRFESWEASVADRIGLGVAVDYAMEWGIDRIRARVVELAERLRRRLSAIPGVAVHDLGAERCAIVTFTVRNLDADDIAHRLHDQGIQVSVSRAEYAMPDLPDRGLSKLVRASVHYFTNDRDLDRLITAVEGCRSSQGAIQPQG